MVKMIIYRISSLYFPFGCISNHLCVGISLSFQAVYFIVGELQCKSSLILNLVSLLLNPWSWTFLWSKTKSASSSTRSLSNILNSYCVSLFSLLVSKLNSQFIQLFLTWQLPEPLIFCLPFPQVLSRFSQHLHLR